MLQGTTVCNGDSFHRRQCGYQASHLGESCREVAISAIDLARSALEISFGRCFETTELCAGLEWVD